MKYNEIFDTKLNENLMISVGKNAKHNWEIIDDSAPTDLWFHVEYYPSSHVILHLNDISPSEINPATLLYCAKLCKTKSSVKNETNVIVILSFVKNITKGDHIGSVENSKIFKKLKI